MGCHSKSSHYYLHNYFTQLLYTITQREGEISFSSLGSFLTHFLTLYFEISLSSFGDTLNTLFTLLLCGLTNWLGKDEARGCG